MPKDRLAAMQQKAGGDDEDFAVPVDDEIEGSMATYLKDIEEIRANCDKIDGKMKDVKKLQSEILSSPTVDAKMQSQMDDYMAEIKKIANGVRTKYVENMWFVFDFNKIFPDLRRWNRRTLRRKKAEAM